MNLKYLQYLQYRGNDWNTEDIEERVLSMGPGSSIRQYKWVWKDPFDDEGLYESERMWITDIFEPKTTQFTEERDKYPKFAPKRPCGQTREELQIGDTAQLDSFLAGFIKKEVQSV